MEFKDQIVVVTGGNSGIGNSVCHQVAGKGGRVINGDIHPEAFEKFLAELPNQDLKHGAFPVDVSKKDSVDAFYDQVSAFTSGQVPHALIHCAGVVKNIQGLELDTEEVYDLTMNVNMKGTYLMNRKFILAMKAAGIRGAIVNFASVAAEGVGAFPVYSASKGAVASFTKSLAKEFGAYGIRTNAVAPGMIATPIFAGVGVRHEDMTKENSQMLQQVRKGEPHEAARVAVFLASNATASFVNGSIYQVDGGVHSVSPAKPLLY